MRVRLSAVTGTSTLDDLAGVLEEIAPRWRFAGARAVRRLGAGDTVTVAFSDRAGAELFVGRAAAHGSTRCDSVPELVWHYLSDADIRVRDRDFAAAQCAGLERLLNAER